MAKRYMPWEEIVLWSLLGGVLALGVAAAGLWLYRWAWNEQALLDMTVQQEKLYSLLVFATGAAVTAAALTLGAAKRTGSGITGFDNKKRRR
jgi:hypothetical protein